MVNDIVTIGALTLCVAPIIKNPHPKKKGNANRQAEKN
jgi:hypothetical protein